MSELKYHRVLLKVSGEGLSGPGQMGVAATETRAVAQQIAELAHLGVQVAVVSGAGNFIRGSVLCHEIGIPQAVADQMGMLATVINSLALEQVLRQMDVPAVVLSAKAIPGVCEGFMRDRALCQLNNGKVVILAGGTGNPFFTTDSCAALRAAEIDAELVIKATKVDGVYSADPVKDPSARRYDHLTFAQILHENLRVMDHTAVSMCRDNNMNIVVCNLWQADALTRLVQGEKVGSFITSEK